MALAKRVFLFLALNVLIMVTISTLLNVLGVKPYLTAQGINYASLIAFCLVWGMGGAFISLGLSRIMAKWMMGVKVIPADTRDPELRELVQTVHELSRAAKLPVMPEVGIYDSPEINAFATGPTKSRSLVAVSSGLLQRMNTNEVRGVLGHEVAHIANGDMVTMTLLQGVVNAFVMFLARVIAFALTTARQDNEEESSAGPSLAYYAVQFVLEIFFMILGSIVVAWFSRYREYRADLGGAKLAGTQNMIQALQGLQRTLDLVDPQAQPAVQSMKISSRGGRFMKLFSTHPPLEDRIQRLKGRTL
ncbi:protease HtpX [Bdellovibrio sp. HCB337]|uniref:protease HtpX n=1 Tax=Bdellovibrio sp. HCB337 TaxID=3394358 RepID=UPI0039A44C90